MLSFYCKEELFLSPTVPLLTYHYQCGVTDSYFMQGVKISSCPCYFDARPVHILPCGHKLAHPSLCLAAFVLLFWYRWQLFFPSQRPISIRATALSFPRQHPLLCHLCKWCPLELCSSQFRQHTQLCTYRFWKIAKLSIFRKITVPSAFPIFLIRDFHEILHVKRTTFIKFSEKRNMTWSSYQNYTLTWWW